MRCRRRNSIEATPLPEGTRSVRGGTRSEEMSVATMKPAAEYVAVRANGARLLDRALRASNSSPSATTVALTSGQNVQIAVSPIRTRQRTRCSPRPPHRSQRRNDPPRRGTRFVRSGPPARARLIATMPRPSARVQSSPGRRGLKNTARTSPTIPSQATMARSTRCRAPACTRLPRARAANAANPLSASSAARGQLRRSAAPARARM